MNEEIPQEQLCEAEIYWPVTPPIIDLRTGPKDQTLYTKWRQIAERAAMIRDGLNGLDRISAMDIPEGYITISPNEIKKRFLTRKLATIRRIEEDFQYSVLTILNDETKKHLIGKVYLSRIRNNSRDAIVVRNDVFNSFIENRSREPNVDHSNSEFQGNIFGVFPRQYPKRTDKGFIGE